MNALESITIFLNGGYRLEAGIFPDESPDNPNDWGNEEVFNAQRGNDLIREAKSTFGCYGGERDEDDNEGWQRALEELASGKVVVHEGAYYVGFEEYRHSGSAYALCSNRGNFPDRNWDVIPLAGWVKWEYRRLNEWLIKGGQLDEEGLLKATKGSLETWQSFVNGECYGYVVTLYHEKDDGYEKEVAEGSCWGFLGDLDYCKEQALEEAMTLVAEIPQELRPAELGKWEDYE